MTPSNDKLSPIKNKPLRYPGQYLDKEIEIIQLKRFRNISLFLVILAIAVYELLHAYAGIPPQPILATILVLAFGSFFYYEDAKLRNKARRYKQGSLGEKIVGETLEKLKKEGCRVFHDVVINDANFNIDHVILSKRGIFAVETKTISKPNKGQISSNGKAVFLSGENPDNASINQTINNAKSLRRYLNESTERQFPVTPVLVYPGWFVEKYMNNNIWVLNPKILQHCIEKEPEIMSQADYDKAELYLSAVSR